MGRRQVTIGQIASCQNLYKSIARACVRNGTDCVADWHARQSDRSSSQLSGHYADETSARSRSYCAWVRVCTRNFLLLVMRARTAPKTARTRSAHQTNSSQITFAQKCSPVDSCTMPIAPVSLVIGTVYRMDTSTEFTYYILDLYICACASVHLQACVRAPQHAACVHLIISYGCVAVYTTCVRTVVPAANTSSVRKLECKTKAINSPHLHHRPPGRALVPVWRPNPLCGANEASVLLRPQMT